jgi:hypothetical protein
MGEKELHLCSKELSTAASTCPNESPGVGIDVSWASKEMGGVYRTLRLHPMYIDQ